MFWFFVGVIVVRIISGYILWNFRYLHAPATRTFKIEKLIPGTEHHFSGGIGLFLGIIAADFANEHRRSLSCPMFLQGIRHDTFRIESVSRRLLIAPESMILTCRRKATFSTSYGSLQYPQGYGFLPNWISEFCLVLFKITSYIFRFLDFLVGSINNRQRTTGVSPSFRKDLKATHHIQVPRA